MAVFVLHVHPLPQCAENTATCKGECVQNYAQVWIDVTHWMVQGSWESENVTPSNPSIPLTPPPPPPQPPRLTPSPPAHHHQTPAAGSLPHLTPSSTYWVLGNHWCSAPSAATTPAPSLVGLSHLGPYDGGISGEGFGVEGGCRLTSQKGAVKSEKKIKTSVIGVRLTVTSFLLCPSSPRSNFSARAGNVLLH